MAGFLSLVLLAVGFCAAQDTPPPERKPDLLKQLDDEDPEVRKAAFEKLRVDADKSKLRSALRKLRKQWLRKCVTVRTSAVRKLLGSNDTAAVKRKRSEVEKLLAKEDTKTAKPIVEEMWKIKYCDPKEADRDPEVVAVRDRVLELHGYLCAINADDGVDYKERIAGEFFEADEDVLIGRMPTSSQGIMKANKNARSKISPGEYQMVFLTNQYRALMGKKALKINTKLCKAARGHSKDMHDHGFFSHRSPIKGKETSGKRAAKEGASCNGENISRAGDLHRVFWGWFSSIGHNRNMLRGYQQIGVGNHDKFWTQMFSASKR
ncbi:MAG: CAP domain-containing protein [Planctomycetota bacterium]